MAKGGAGKGKGSASDARADAEPYATAEGDAKEDKLKENLQIMVADSKAATAEAKDTLSQLETLQQTMNTLLAKVNAMASAEDDL